MLRMVELCFEFGPPFVCFFVCFEIKGLNLLSLLISCLQFNLTCRNFKVNVGVKVTCVRITCSHVICTKVKILPTYFSTPIQGHIQISNCIRRTYLIC